MTEETFDHDQVVAAIEVFLKYGEDSYGKCHEGYFANSGWAAGILRSHLKSLQKIRRNENANNPTRY